MIELITQKLLLGLEGRITIAGVPGCGKTTLLNHLGVDYRPEPTEDVDTLGLRITPDKYTSIVVSRMFELDCHDSRNWRDGDFFTSVGIFQGASQLEMEIKTAVEQLIVSDHLVFLDPPLDLVLRQIQTRDRKVAGSEAAKTFERYQQARKMFKLHPAPYKYVLWLDSQDNFKLSPDGLDYMLS